jgi:hypothetical protein
VQGVVRWGRWNFSASDTGWPPMPISQMAEVPLLD